MQNTVAKKYYRFGVLEGNHVEERFGLDHAATLKDAKLNTISEMKDRYNVKSSMYGVQETAKATPVAENVELLASTTLTQAYHITPEKETLLRTNAALSEKTDEKNALAFTHAGEKADTFFGHGIQDNDFQRRELVTTYNLTYGNKIKPVQYIFSKFDSTTVAPIINPEDKVYIKNHLRNVPAIGDTQNLTAQKTAKPYNDFTKTFDTVQAKIPFRK